MKITLPCFDPFMTVPPVPFPPACPAAGPVIAPMQGNPGSLLIYRRFIL